MKFSVIVVCYNAGDKLMNTINSILLQSYQNYEIVIKDGMSSDHSLEKLPKNEKLRLISSKDQGIYDAMNQAVSFASGDYLYFLNCGDSFFDAQVLDRTAQFIKENAGKGIYYGDTFNELSNSYVPVPKAITPFTCYRHIPCHQACIYEKGLCIEKKYDRNYRIRADYDHFLWCYFRKGAKPKHMGFTIANYEGGGFSETKENKKVDQKEHKEITERYLSKGQLYSYRIFMIITLMPLRRYLSNNRCFSKAYQGIKRLFY